ncbi:MAG TPA: hypothetical protein VMH39_15215, partial [Gemmatimonadaceae bacterium]|nr:hypothetical protein [Gemmatimonadaceae bacterium]
GSARVPRAVVRGGIGYFQNMTSAGSLLNSVISSTGLPSSAQQVTCIGSAAPTPDWSAYAVSPDSVPTACADGTQGTVFASTAPNVYVYDPSFMQPRSLRATLGWSGAILWNYFNASVNGTVARNQHLPSWVDVNFSPASVPFTLSDEGNRPVYANPADIVASTGLIAARDARVSQLFTSVHELRSDGLQEARQISFGISPVAYSGVFGWRFAYTYQTIRDLQNGFNTNTAGNPLDAQWGEAANQWHHQFQLAGSYYWNNLITIAPQLSLVSPSAYTPVVASDINGDGYANDRAFIFDPAHTSDPILASGMQALLASGSADVRQCLQSQLGRIAARSSCQGPWTVGYSSLSININPQRVRLSQRTKVSLSISNPAAGLDLLLHGENRLHGWGESPVPQQQLLYVRGFNQSTDQYLYTVNPRFGSTSLALTTFRVPAKLTVLFNYTIGPSRERQTLLQGLDHGRTTPGTKYPEATIKSIASSGIVDPLSAILRASDSLHLTTTQADSISTLNRYFTTRQDSIWAPIAQYLAALPNKYNDDDAYAHYVAGREATIDLLLAIGPKIDGLLSADQRRRLPAQAEQWLDPHFLKLMRSSTISP